MKRFHISASRWCCSLPTEHHGAISDLVRASWTKATQNCDVTYWRRACGRPSTRPASSGYGIITEHWLTDYMLTHRRHHQPALRSAVCYRKSRALQAGREGGSVGGWGRLFMMSAKAEKKRHIIGAWCSEQPVDQRQSKGYDYRQTCMYMSKNSFDP